MKYTLFILTIIFMALLFTAKAQVDTVQHYKAGTELIRFDKQFKSGLFMQVAGLIMVGASTQVTEGKPLIIGGGALAFIGGIIMATASDHVRKAGLYLRGNSLIVPISKKR